MFTWWTSLWLAVWQPLVKPLHHRLISSAVWLSSPLLIKTCLNLNLMLLYSMVPLCIYIHVQCTHVDTIFYPIFLKWVYDVIGKFSRLSSSFCHLMIGYPWPHPWTFPRLRCPGLGCGSNGRGPMVFSCPRPKCNTQMLNNQQSNYHIDMMSCIQVLA